MRARSNVGLNKAKDVSNTQAEWLIKATGGRICGKAGVSSILPLKLEADILSNQNL